VVSEEEVQLGIPSNILLLRCLCPLQSRFRPKSITRHFTFLDQGTERLNNLSSCRRSCGRRAKSIAGVLSRLMVILHLVNPFSEVAWVADVSAERIRGSAMSGLHQK
jgi:hypothetical protein